MIIKWLAENGLKVNEKKMEVCMFNKKDFAQCSILINGSEIKVENTIKILGVIFDSKLTWSEHCRHALNRANKAKQGLCLIRKYFTQTEMLKLATAFFYSTLYYGAKIWLISTLNHVIKRQLWQISSRMLQIVDGKRDQSISFLTLHKKYNRATPAMWNKYVTA